MVENPTGLLSVRDAIRKLVARFKYCFRVRFASSSLTRSDFHPWIMSVFEDPRATAAQRVRLLQMYGELMDGVEFRSRNDRDDLARNQIQRTTDIIVFAAVEAWGDGGEFSLERFKTALAREIDAGRLIVDQGLAWVASELDQRAADERPTRPNGRSKRGTTPAAPASTGPVDEG